jgi:hypothetical protein
MSGEITSGGVGPQNEVELLRAAFDNLPDTLLIAATPQTDENPRMEYMATKAGWRAIFSPTVAQPATMYAKVEGLRIRAQPSTSAAILRELHVGEAVSVLSVTGQWASVTAPLVGYVYAPSLSVTRPT